MHVVIVAPHASLTVVCVCLPDFLLLLYTIGSLFSVIGCLDIAIAALASVIYNGAFPVLGQSAYYLMSGLYAVPIPALMYGNNATRMALY